MGIRLVVLALAVLAALVGVDKASAAQPCWKVLINDWYDGRIDRTYAPRCYREAIKHLPRDVRNYASAAEDIERARRLALQNRGRGRTNTDDGATRTVGNGGDERPPGTTTRPPADDDPVPTIDEVDETETETQAGPIGRDKDGDGPLGDVLGKISPSNADAVPLPLLVLAGIALLLLAAAAASFVARRLQERRVPGGPGEPPDPPLP